MLLEHGDIQKRLDDPDNLINRLRSKQITLHGQGKMGGRQLGDTNLPPIMREIVAVAANIDSPAQAARDFGISAPHAQNLRDAKVNGTTVNEELEAKLDTHIGKIREAALEKTLKAMGLITESKLEAAKARELSAIAKDLAGVYEKISPAVKETGNPSQVVVYAPQTVNIEKFAVVEVRDTVDDNNA